MKHHRIIATLVLLVACAASLAAQERTKSDEERVRPQIDTIDLASFTDEMLDTVQVNKKLSLNDYSMVGIEYGATLSQVMWNPTQRQNMLFLPNNIGITFTT